ncbi:MAG: PEP-CTERM sorting domain-containing protein [Sphingobium sp.]|nr:PEP-CTERM sorting domain-containing protein [Sphingobium sp.]MBP6112151.1 PEP-CTERM sorting domain-containing protein [Sphingobium sp.]MBP9157661.1 PEP-CTERM sorting domain-containing protein [Sphingobium sp.]MCC6482642.1 PEP-CTERM sorting domain-containing protein [Sphingomonadaceae bacterium]
MEEINMRFVRTLAAAAILGCSMVAGQAAALPILYANYNLVTAPGESPLSSLVIRHPYGGMTSTYHIPINMGHWGGADSIAPGYKMNTLHYLNTPQAATLYVGLFKFKAPLPERYQVISFDFAPGTFASTGTFQSIGAMNAQITIGFKEGPRVPEPSTWALMIVGFGAIGSAMRRRVRGRALALT